ncbi:MAG: hypothetical protein EPO21_01055 [Chloroflexota bacterium]|nr:MAG: hypothetical protein EPO21_01055 [Chloroflexota bacterium]
MGVGRGVVEATNRPRMRLAILNDTSHRDGCTYCFDTWSTPEDITFIVGRLRERYGDQVTVEYVDVALHQPDADDARLVELARQQGLPLPIVAINGSIKLIGAADYRVIAEAIEAQGGM